MRIKRDTLEGYNIWVIQMSPYSGLPEEQLQNHQTEIRSYGKMSYLFCRVLITICVYPKPLDTNVRAKGPTVRITEPPMSEGGSVRNRKSPRNVVGSGENFPSPADLPQHVKTLSVWDADVSETIEGLWKRLSAVFYFAGGRLTSLR